MATLTEGIIISDVRLTKPSPPWKLNSKVQIVIKYGNQERKSKKTTFKKRDPYIIWDESFFFVGELTDDTPITFTIIRVYPLRIRNTAVDSCEHRVIELLKTQNSTGSCKFDIAGKCRVTFKIEKSSDVVLGVVQQTSAVIGNLPNLEVPAKAANLLTSVAEAYSNNEDTWSSFLDKFGVFMKFIDDVSEISPYAKMAWSVLSVIPKTIIAKKNRDDKIKRLCDKLENVYNYITDAKRLPKLTETQSKTLSKVVRQTTECAYFIRAYCAEDAVHNTLKGIIGSADRKVQDFDDEFSRLMQVMRDSVSLETSIVTLRVREDIGELIDQASLAALKDMRYGGTIPLPGKRCLPGTRKTLIEDILKYINDDASPQILVVSGQAGVGKSTIAHTIAAMFKEQNRLGSMFCFDKSFPNKRNCLFSTISRDLADSDVSWRKELIKIIAPSTATRETKDAETQFNEFIIKPSKNVATIGPVIIVVDALDESGDRSEREKILEILFDRWIELPKNYRIIVTTRPEQDIEYQCQKPGISHKRMGDIDSKETYHDIKAYVSGRLNRISSTLDSIDKDWRSILAKQAQGLFQWAQTACRFIDPTVIDEETIREKWETCVSDSSLSLYELYHQIISSQPESRRPRFKEKFKTVVGAIISAQEPLSMDTLQNIFKDIINIKSTLGPFGSLFSGVHDSSDSTMVQPLHTSLFDFFKAEKISEEDQQVGEKMNEYYINMSDQSQMTLGCLSVMNRMLCFNICHLETSHLRNSDVPDFYLRVKKAIPLHLSYSCRFWTFHLRSSPVSGELIRAIRTLMDNKLMYYFEALSLLGALRVGLERDCVAMREIVNWCKHADGDLAENAMDAWTFVFDFGKIIEESTPHLYISALPLAPRGSFVSRKYLERYPGLFAFDVGQPVSSSRKVGFMQKNDDWSYSRKTFAFSPKGECAAIGSGFDFYVWNYVTGEREVCRPTYKYPFFLVSSIVFSPDGELIYCCLTDGNILTWNMRTKETKTEMYEEIIGGQCLYCAISSDGRSIVWRTERGVLLVFDRPSRRVVKRFENVAWDPFPAISPNGDWIAVCGWDIGGPRVGKLGDRVYTWNTRNQTQHVIPCHDSWKLALSNSYIAFSLDRGDAAIEIWSLRTNTKVTDFQHGGDIHLSPDDHYIISIFRGMYSIWIVSTGELISRSYVEHLERCLGFSHDSKAIALYTSGDTHSLYVQQWDKSIEPNHPHDNKIGFVFGIWQRGSYLILWYGTHFYERFLQVSDNMTTIFEAELQAEGPVDVYPEEENVWVAYASRRGLCLWSEKGGEIVIDGSGHSIRKLLWLDNYVISGCERTISIWDSRTCKLVYGPIDLPYNWCSLLPVRGTRFAVSLARAFDDDVKIKVWGSLARAFDDDVEVKVWELEPGDRVREISTVKSTDPIVSANEKHLICMSEYGVDILDLTGTRVGSIPFSHGDPERRRSSNGKYMAWVDGDEIELFDVDTESLLTGPSLGRSDTESLLNGPSLGRSDIKFCFSNDSKQVIIASKASTEGHTGLLDVWDIQSKKMVTNTVHFPLSRDNGITNLVLSKKYLVASSWYRDYYVLDLDTCGIMFPLYENPSLPAADGSDIEGTPASNKTETLNYALTAWKKASFSALAEADHNGWVKGLKGELLFWVPEKMRERLWLPCRAYMLPCMAYMPYGNYTKLNFTNFVHGTNWTQCGPRDD